MTSHDPKYPVVSGFDHVSDTDLVAQIAGVDPNDAHEVLDRVGGIRHLATCDIEILLNMPGIGPSTARRLLAAVELGRRLESIDLDQKVVRIQLRTWRATSCLAYETCAKRFFWCCMLDARNTLIRGVTVSVGSLTASHRPSPGGIQARDPGLGRLGDIRA